MSTRTNASIHQELAAKASQDPAFRAALLKAPKETVEAHFGIALPSGMKVQAIEAPVDTVVVVLPAPLRSSGELDDAALESVAGGVGGDSGWWRPGAGQNSTLPPGVIPFIPEPCSLGGR